MKIRYSIRSCLAGFLLISALQANAQNFENRIQLNPVYAPFYHGVASGDALFDRVIIWTRVTPDSTVGTSTQVEWKMATDTTFTNIVAQGNTVAEISRDYTVKVDVSGLQAGTWYYFYFRALGKNSIVGRTKTTPAGDNDSIRFAVVTGSNYNSGYFNAYHAIAKRNDIDAILHLGDYIYEYETDGYGNNPDRSLAPSTEVIDSSDYRMRYAHYRLDPDLMYLHQQYPWYVIWDDHETANNSYKSGAENHDPVTEGNWFNRVNAGVEAYLEWLPIREQNPAEPLKIYRSVRFGNLMELIFLETRLIARDNQSMSINDPDKTMLGTDQFNWLTSKLKASDAQWNILAQQVMMAPLATIGQITVNTDQWDGYPKERERLLRFVIDSNIQNFVVLTGDIHTSWGNDLMYESGTLLNPESYKSAGGEFITPSISSPSTNDFLGGLGSSLLTLLIPHIQYSNLDKRGYMIFDLNKSRAQADWYLMPNADISEHHIYTETFDDSWYLMHNKADHKIEHSGSPSVRYPANPPRVSVNPFGISGVNEHNTNNSSIIGFYPNPVSQNGTLVLYYSKRSIAQILIHDTRGRLVWLREKEVVEAGINYIGLNLSSLVSGNYILTVLAPDGKQKLQIIKL